MNTIHFQFKTLMLTLVSVLCFSLGEAYAWTVTLHEPDGGTVTPALTEYTEGVGATLPNVTRSGYAFEGWWDNDAFTGDPVEAISTTDSGDKEFWGKWANVAEVDINGTKTYYTSLNDALTYAQNKYNSPVITVLRDLTGITKQLYIKRQKSTTTITIDLNGHTISGSVTTDVPASSSGSPVNAALFCLDRVDNGKTNISVHITDKSAGGGGTIIQNIDANYNACGVYVQNDWMKLSKITVESHNSYAKAGSRAVYVRYGRKTAFEDCIFNTTANNGTAYGVADGGTTSYANCSITVSTTASATGIYSYQNTSTVSTTTMDITGGNITRAMTACGQTPGDGTTTSAGSTYRGGLIVNSGTFNVSGKNVVHGVYVYSSIKANDETSTTLGGNQTSYGQATIKGGTFTIEGTGTDVGAVYAGAQKTVSEAKKLDGTNYPSETTKNNVWILGGKFKVTTTAASQTTINKDAPVDSVTIKGGYYSDTTNFYRVTAPVKDVNYAMFPTTEEGADYPWKVCEAYVVNFMNEDGSETLKAIPTEISKSPVYDGATPFKPGTGGDAYVFDGWSETIGGEKLASLPAVTSAGATYYAHFVTASAVASVDEGSNPTKYFSSIQDALDYAADKTAPTITLLDDIEDVTTQLIYQPTVKGTSTIDLNGHVISGSVTSDSPTGTQEGNSIAKNTLFVIDAPKIDNSDYIIHITDYSVTGNGRISHTVDVNATACALHCNNGKMDVSNITIECTNEKEYASGLTGITTRAIYVRYNHKASFTNCIITATGSIRVYGIEDGGETLYENDSIYIKETKQGNTAGILCIQNTSTVNNCKITMDVKSSGRAFWVQGRSITSTITYNGKVIVNGGKYIVNGTNAIAAFYIDGNKNNTNNKVSSGQVTVNDGEFIVNSTSDTNVRAIYIKEKETTTGGVSTANKITVNGGKFQVNATPASASLGLGYDKAEQEFVELQGGFYSDTVNFYKYVEPAKSCNYYVLPTTEDERDEVGPEYLWKVREAYVVNFMSEDGETTLQTGPQEKNTTPVFDGTPTKEATAEYTYTFDGWSTTIGGEKLESLHPVTSAGATYYAHFAKTTRNYTVTVERNNTDYGTVSTASIADVPYGSAITVNGNEFTVNGTTVTATPTSADAQYTYAFSGWTDVPATVEGNVIITANFTRTVNTYTVTVERNNTDYGTVSTASIADVPYGSAITVNGNEFTVNGTTVTATPTAATDQYTYTFSNWTDVPATVEGNVIITANFTRTVNTYTVTVERNNTDYGTVSTASIADVPYGSAITVNGNEFTVNGTTVTATPTAATDQYTYTFSGWTNASGTIEGDMTVTANFTRTVNTYTVTVERNNTDYGTVSTASIADVPYGSAITVNGNEFTVNGTTVTATPTAATDQYTYTFSGWTNASGTVEGDMTVTANFTRTENTYTVTWKNYNGETLETDENVAYGTEPTYNGTPPTKPADAEHTYTFSTWYPATSSVTGNVEYTAQFTATDNVASVTTTDGTEYFTAFNDAWTYVNSLDKAMTIKLLKDVATAASLEYTAAANCTLDLNHHTISGEVTKLIDVNASGKTFTIDDSSAEQDGAISMVGNANSRLYALFITAGRVNLKHGKIYSKNEATYDASSASAVAATAVYVTTGKTFIMDGGTVESEAQKASYAIYAKENGTTTITINNGLVKGHTNAFSDAAGIVTHAKGLTVNGGRIVGHTWTNTSYGIYLTGGSATLNGGTIEATNDTINNNGTTTTYGIYVKYVSGTYKGVLNVPSTSTIRVLAKSRTNIVSAVYMGGATSGTIAGGTFTATAKTGYTARGIYSLGAITVSGGTFNVYAATTNSTTTTVPCGIYAQRGTITVSGNPVFNINSGADRAYGVYAYGTVDETGTKKYSGTIKINGGTFNVTTTSSIAYGAYAGVYSKTVVEAEGNVAGTHCMPGIIEITGGTFKVTAGTNAAYGIRVDGSKTESGFEGATTKYPQITVKGGMFNITSGDENATAYAMNATASASYQIIQGGKYTTKKTSASSNPVIEGKYTAPAKWCGYWVRELPESESPYQFEVVGEIEASVTPDGGSATNYLTIDSAFNAANNYEVCTIKLLKDISNVSSSACQLNYTRPNGFCTLDLNNHTLAGTVKNTTDPKMMHINASGCTFTITDNSVEKGGLFSMVKSGRARYEGILVSQGTLSVEGGKVYSENSFTWNNTSGADNAAVDAIQLASGARLLVSGGTIEAQSQLGARAVNALGNSTVIISGGTLKAIDPVAVGSGAQNSKAMSLYTEGGETIINGGTFLAETNSTKVTAYNIYATSAEQTITVSDGKFQVSGGAGMSMVNINDETDAENMALTGGYYSHITNLEKYCVAPKTPILMSAAECSDVGMPANSYKIAELPSEPLDIVDWTTNGDGTGTLTINANGWAIGGWPYTINGTAYYADEDAATDAGSNNFRAPDRTIEIPYSGEAGSTITIDLQNSESTVISHRDYTVPFIGTVDGTDASSIVVVNTGTLEIASAVELAELRVRPEASVNITGSLTVGKLVLRTLPWQAASINGDFTAHEVWYTRIAPNNRTISGPDGEITYSSDRYYQLAFPLPTMKPLNQVGVSHGAKTTYGKAWLLKQYEEPQRAEHGAGYEGNWHVVPEEASIEAGRGYEMANNSTYYREFYFQVGTEDFNTTTWYAGHDKKVAVHYDIYNEDAANAGWNVIGSPLMGAYDNSEAGPEGIKISELQTDGSYVQSIPEVIHSGVPFSYQASEEGFLSFAGDALQIASVRRRALTEEEVRVQWLRLELKDAQGRGDETSVLSHPTRYEETYKTGIDVAKQSLEATRALIYSSHAYGAMAFAGVSDALLENGVALTVFSPSEQELTFSLRDNNWLDRMAYVWLVDNETGMRTDLLTQDYRFDAKPGTTEGRFILQGAFKAPQGTTDIENGEVSDNKAKARKLIIKDKMYIMVNDQLYDATGKQIKK